MFEMSNEVLIRAEVALEAYYLEVFEGEPSFSHTEIDEDEVFRRSSTESKVPAWPGATQSQMLDLLTIHANRERLGRIMGMVPCLATYYRMVMADSWKRIAVRLFGDQRMAGLAKQMFETGVRRIARIL